MKRGSTSHTIVGREAQVDLCPGDGGMVVSIGPLSIWLSRADAEDLVETLEMALLVSSKDPKPGAAGTEGAASGARRALAVS